MYEADDTVKDILPSKNTDDELEHELDYTKTLLDVVDSNPTFSEVPKSENASICSRKCLPT